MYFLYPYSTPLNNLLDNSKDTYKSFRSLSSSFYLLIMSNINTWALFSQYLHLANLDISRSFRMLYLILEFTTSLISITFNQSLALIEVRDISAIVTNANTNNLIETNTG